MKKLLLSASAVALSFAAMAQCNQLFISEYVVGTGNDKAYELYNPTANDIDLGPYQLQRFSNGSNTASDLTELMGTIPAYGTWVVANGQTEDIDLGTFISPKCSPELQALADQLDNPYPAPTFMNGNDALILVLNPSTAPVICDIFAKYGEDPGEAWTAPDGTYITSGHTMIRKPNIMGGVTVNPIVFDPLAEWDTLPVNTWTNLGMHSCDCNPTSSISDRTPLDVTIYPTLVKDNAPITIKTNLGIKNVEVYDITGKIVKSSLSLANSNSGILSVGNLASGAYILNVYLEDNVTYSTKFVKE